MHHKTQYIDIRWSLIHNHLDDGGIIFEKSISSYNYFITRCCFRLFCVLQLRQRIIQLPTRKTRLNLLRKEWYTQRQQPWRRCTIRHTAVGKQCYYSTCQQWTKCSATGTPISLSTTATCKISTVCWATKIKWNT